uniref:Uracil phosphoribosyltransferase n=1 Tax=Neogoniolithon spectabile TaxID=231755 RepID=A0A3G3MGL8_9FLOR|nr:uracil phosphoribosyltransferase [Neogoniolithon spectabile]AYR05975.1 uracil phosphoribosyltransferase [Neogoniolithon spectabile]
MKLNIRIVSHPIITYLSNINKYLYLPYNLEKYILSQLGLFLIYESLRDWLLTYRLTIQKLDYQDSITIIDPQESYMIITDQQDSLHFIQEIAYIIPKCKVKVIDLENSLPNELTEIKTNTKIIIALCQSKIFYLIELIRQLTETNNLNIQHIRVCTIYCKNEDLIQISDRYPKLNIYTTRIIRSII